jgi:O-antigen/teichoic acid export membrane protein
MQKSRINYSIYNITTNIGSRIILLILSFFSRTIFIYVLGEKYLGISGLFSNIISILSLAELGIGGSIIYAMYVPLAKNDQKKLAALMNYYKKLYIIIGICVTIIGLCLIPFLHLIVKFDTPLPNIEFYYLLYLINTASTYFFVYKTSIINADQKGYKLTITNTVFYVICFFMQNAVLLISKNFTLYLITQIVFSILPNVYNSFRVEKLYPYIKSSEQLTKDEKKGIWVNIKSMFSYQIGNVVLNNTASIFISIFVGTVTVGYYSNYMLLISSVAGITGLIFSSIQASVGNLVANSDSLNQYKMFKNITFLAFWIYSFCSVCFCLLLNDFILIWIGESYLLNIEIIYVCVFNFYIAGILYPIWIYRNTIGLFTQTKNIMIFTSLINIVLSYILGTFFGLIGVLISIGTSRLLTNVWFEPYKLFKVYFHVSLKKYYLKQIFSALLTVCIIVLGQYICSLFFIQRIVLRLGIKAIICIIVPNVIIYFIFRKTQEFNYILNIVKDLTKKIKMILYRRKKCSKGKLY